MNSRIHIGDVIRIKQLSSEPSVCDWSDNFDEVFTVIGFAQKFEQYGFKDHWRDVTNDYTFIDTNDLKTVPVADIPYLILDKPLSDMNEIIHPIYVSKDIKLSRCNRVNKLLNNLII